MVEVLNENIFQDQDDEADGTLCGLLKEVLGQQNLALMVDFNYPEVCCKNSGA